MGSPPKNSPPDCFSPLLLFGSNKYFAAPSRRSQFALSFAPLTRIASKNYIRAALVYFSHNQKFRSSLFKGLRIPKAEPLAAPSRRRQFALSLTPFARIENQKYIRAALVYVPIIKSFVQSLNFNYIIFTKYMSIHSNEFVRNIYFDLLRQ